MGMCGKRSAGAKAHDAGRAGDLITDLVQHPAAHTDTLRSDPIVRVAAHKRALAETSVYAHGKVGPFLVLGL